MIFRSADEDHIVISDHVFIDGAFIYAKTSTGDALLGAYDNYEEAKQELERILDKIIDGIKHIRVKE